MAFWQLSSRLSPQRWAPAAVNLHHFLDPSFLIFGSQGFLCSVTAGTPPPHERLKESTGFASKMTIWDPFNQPSLHLAGGEVGVQSGAGT